MSYCRWSSMNWMCDVYVYKDVSCGYTICVATNRKIIPPIPDIKLPKISIALHSWSKCHLDDGKKVMVYPLFWRGIVYRVWVSVILFWLKHVHMRSLSLTPDKRIGLPYDGYTFHHNKPEYCANKLEQLRSLGYKVPQSAINALRAETGSK